MGSFFTPKGFLTYGGAVLLALGLIGYAGIFKTEGSAFWLDGGENIAHTVLGLVALAAVFVPGLNSALAPLYRPIVTLVGIIALFFGVYGLYAGITGVAILNTFGAANLEYLDDIVHLAVAAWAYMSLRSPAMAKAM